VEPQLAVGLAFQSPYSLVGGHGGLVHAQPVVLVASKEGRVEVRVYQTVVAMVAVDDQVSDGMVVAGPFFVTLCDIVRIVNDVCRVLRQQVIDGGHDEKRAEGCHLFPSEGV
jgi:hypothetical protein